MAERRQGVHPEADRASDPTVLLIDPNADRQAEIVRLVQDCAARATTAPAPGSSAAILGDETIVCALVAADRAVVDRPGFATTVREFRQAEIPVLCYADGAATWPLALRCELLMWGVHPLLDSAGPGFLPNLGRALTVRLSRSIRSRAEHLSIQEMIGSVGIVARSTPMLRMLHLVERLSHLSDIPVLILGETGTGKEMIARVLHNLDPRRRNSPMVAVNCAALPKSLAEAELFGHSRGAFSGADRHRMGLIRAANGGVLLLDEIGDLDLGLQTKLLRVLQEGRVLPLGEDQELPIDVRVLAATHQDLPAMVHAGLFREDLLHRISIMPIRVPPLRERKEDVAPLVDAFLAKYCGLRSVGPPTATFEFIDALGRVELPGNVRQLENIVRRALAEADHDEPLGLADLPAEVWEELAHAPATTATTDALKPNTRIDDSRERDLNLARTIESCERSTVEAALMRANGSQAAAARILGISYRGIYNKIRKYGLSGSPKAR
jgi:transcriptional regulator with GAF, ATPase, and Fis domain